MRTKALTDRQRLDKQIGSIIDTIVEVGRTAALVDRLRRLEEEEAPACAEAGATVPLLTGIEEAYVRLVDSLETLGSRATTDGVGRAQAALRGILGEVRVVETPDGVLVYPTVRFATAGTNSGAEKRT